MSIMAKHNNRIQTIENNGEINHENGVHLPLKCAILELELEIEKRFCKACRQRPSQKLGFRVSGRIFLLQANDLRSYPSFGWAFVFLGQCWVERGLRASPELPMSTTSARAILHPRYETSHDSTGGKHVSSRDLEGVSPR
jgi:hypothetical protein